MTGEPRETRAVDFAPALAELERSLAVALELAPYELPDGLAELTGSFRGARVRLSARAYAGPHTAYARFVHASGGELEIANVLCLSAAERPLPILGADLVALGKDTLVAVADLSPVHPDLAAREQQLEGLARKAAAWALPQHPAPAWCKPWFSAHALCTRAPVGALTQVLAAVGDAVNAYIELERRTAPAPELAHTTRAAQAAYGAAHREHDRGLGLLNKLFEPASAQRFLSEVLFPERSLA